MTHPPDPGDVTRTNLRSRFVYSDLGIFILSSDVNSAAPAPKVPLINGCLVSYLATLGSIFYHTRQRCLSAILLFDGQTSSWSFTIPRQHCSASHSDWSLAVSAAGSALAAGSFQVLKPRSRAEIMERIPAFDGIHIICDPDPEDCQLVFFLVAGGETHALAPDQIVRDEAEAAIDAFLSAGDAGT